MWLQTTVTSQSQPLTTPTISQEQATNLCVEQQIYTATAKTTGPVINARDSQLSKIQSNILPPTMNIFYNTFFLIHRGLKTDVPEICDMGRDAKLQPRGQLTHEHGP